MTWGSGYGRRWVKEDILQWHYGFILNDENLAYVDDVTHSLQTQEWTATLCWLNMLPPNPPTASPWRANYLPNLPEFHLSKWCSKAQWEENSSFSHVLLQIHNRFWTVSYKIISLVRKVWSVRSTTFLVVLLMWGMCTKHFAWKNTTVQYSKEWSWSYGWSSQPQTQGEKSNLPKVLTLEYAVTHLKNTYSIYKNQQI